MDEANRTYQGHQMELDKTKKMLADLRQRVALSRLWNKPGEELIPDKNLVFTLAKWALFLKEQDRLQHIKLSTLNYNPAGSSEEVLVTKQISVPYTKSVKKIALTISGEYRDYELFKQFLRSLRQFPLAMTKFFVRENNWEMEIDLYGFSPE